MMECCTNSMIVHLGDSTETTPRSSSPEEDNGEADILISEEIAGY